LSKPKTLNYLARFIGAIFALVGSALIAASFFLQSQILAFIGLGLTFWGFIFLLTAPSRYVEENLFVSTVHSEYLNFDRIAKDLGCVERAYYIPSYPRNATVPEHLKGLKNPVVLISTKPDFEIPSIEDIARGKFLISEGNAVLLTPPGMDLLRQIENKLKINLSEADINDIAEILPRTILGNFALAKDFILKIEEGHIYSTVIDSVYKSLYISDNEVKSVQFLGCPFTSAIACVLSQTVGKPVTIAETKVSKDGQTIETEYRVVG
jgi:hypothetical protein